MRGEGDDDEYMGGDVMPNGGIHGEHCDVPLWEQVKSLEQSLKDTRQREGVLIVDCGDLERQLHDAEVTLARAITAREKGQNDG